MSLEQYKRKRRFDETPEPEGRERKTGRQRFVVQEHHATNLHFDFRLEMLGVLKSWAIPKGPSMDPADKRLAVAVEDHPVDYIDFEGTIAEGNYGAGEVYVWDTGKYELVPPGDPSLALAAGKLKFILQGKQLKGEFNLVKLGRGENQWLLMKAKDQHAEKGWRLKQKQTDKPARRAGKTAGKTAAKKASRKRTTKKKAAEPDPASAVRPGRGLAAVPGAAAGPMPEHVDAMLATLVDKPFTDPGWLFETKWDGVRALAYLSGGSVRLISRNDKDMTARYPELAGLAKAVKGDAILDGEIVALDEAGRSNFQLLQARVGLQEAADIERMAAKTPVVYEAFDLLYADGFDLRPGALADRKALLEARLKPGRAVQVSAHRVGEGEKAFREAQARGLEGIIAKRLDSPYLAGRAGGWLKIKTLKRQEVVIGGYTEPRRSRQYLGALVTGVYENGELVYAGHVGGGFNRDSLEKVYSLLQPLRTRQSPFAEPPPTNEAVTWVKPKLVAEVKFAEWTADRRLRQPIFLGLRDDKRPQEVVMEKEKSVKRKVKEAEATAPEPNGHGGNGKAEPAETAFRRKTLSGNLGVKAGRSTVALTHVDRVYWPDEGYTKADLLRYYWTVSETILPYLKDRPLILTRNPNGIAAPGFFQHDVDVDDLPEFVQTLTSEAENGRMIDYVVCNNAATLLYLANLGTIAQNPWNSRAGSLDNPDWIVFDLDPGEVPYRQVCDLALAVREALEGLGLAVYPKTSGSHGMHLYVPLKPHYNYEQAAAFAERLAARVVKANPKLATLERSKGKRSKKLIYLDHLQNARGKSVASAYSVRARPGATVSTPLTWEEVKRGVDPAKYTIKTLPARLAQKGDLFAPVLKKKQGLEQALKRLEAAG